MPEIVAPHPPSAADRAAILEGLASYNASHAPAGFEPVAVLLQEAGATVGGLWGHLLYDWLVIELLFVPEQLRGKALGTELVRRAEAVAVQRNCAGIWLDTFGFQARGFYEKLGYAVFGTLDGHPRGSARFFLRKVLEQSGNTLVA